MPGGRYAMAADRWGHAPAERAAHDAAEAAAASVAAACAAPVSAHSVEVMAHHEGQPSIAVQSKTHGAPLPAVDLGKPVT